ncbi:hypothetical protein F5X99DRAFT_366476 [Biscogniauxia marginata]|nr:hypothetical protein F5X99DRAFT_366476 [Biscogniauxia marginata]
MQWTLSNSSFSLSLLLACSQPKCRSQCDEPAIQPPIPFNLRSHPLQKAQTPKPQPRLPPLPRWVRLGSKRSKLQILSRRGSRVNSQSIVYDLTEGGGGGKEDPRDPVLARKEKGLGGKDQNPRHRGPG